MTKADKIGSVHCGFDCIRCFFFNDTSQHPIPPPPSNDQSQNGLCICYHVFVCSQFYMMTFATPRASYVIKSRFITDCSLCLYL